MQFKRTDSLKLFRCQLIAGSGFFGANQLINYNFSEISWSVVTSEAFRDVTSLPRFSLANNHSGQAGEKEDEEESADKWRQRGRGAHLEIEREGVLWCIRVQQAPHPSHIPNLILHTHIHSYRQYFKDEQGKCVSFIAYLYEVIKNTLV